MVLPHFTPDDAARHLIAAWRGGARPLHRDIEPPDRASAFAVQDATVRALGPVGGWKVGARSPEAEPTCAPLPLAGIHRSGHTLAPGEASLRGIELELGVRLGRDVDTTGPGWSRADLVAAIEAVFPVIEFVDTRLADWRNSSPLAQLADLQSHGALVIGADAALPPHQANLCTLEAFLAFDGQPTATTAGGNPAGDVWRLLEWLARHCQHRGMPLRAGQVVTTGSCTGMLFAPAGAKVVGQLQGLGTLELTV